MDWLYALMPIAGTYIFWPGLLVLGLGVGMISGFFGMGGGWMVTPGLNILGFPMAFSIGTGVTQMAGPSLVSSLRHARFGNVDYKLGVIMIGGTIAGFEPGAQLVMWLERHGKVDAYVQYGYLALLTLIAWLVFTDISASNAKEREARALGKPAAKPRVRHRVAQDPAEDQDPAGGALPQGRRALLGLAAHLGQLRHRPAGRRVRNRRRPDPHARPDLSGRLSPRTWRSEPICSKSPSPACTAPLLTATRAAPSCWPR